MSSCSKQKRLCSDLEQLEVFENPKLYLEQYYTPPRFAAEVLHAVDMDIGLSGKSVLDLGCGCGILGLGCMNSGAMKTLGIDVDREALDIAERNRDDVGLTSETVLFFEADILNLQQENLPVNFRAFDVVVSNPPFGIWSNDKNIDVLFVRKGLDFASVVYSIHKSSTHKFLIKKAKEMDVQLDFLCVNKDFPVAGTYKFHRSKEYSIKVDLAKFERKRINDKS